MELAEAHISYPRHKSNSLAGLSLILLAHRTFYISLIKFNSHLTIEKDFLKSTKLENGQIRKGKGNVPNFASDALRTRYLYEQ